MIILILHKMILARFIRTTHLNMRLLRPFSAMETEFFNPAAKIGAARMFYKETLKHLNEKNRTFTEGHMIKVTELSTSIDNILLMFEAYYNYLGRNVMMQSATIDKMLDKVFKIMRKKKNDLNQDN